MVASGNSWRTACSPIHLVLRKSDPFWENNICSKQILGSVSRSTHKKRFFTLGFSLALMGTKWMNLSTPLSLQIRAMRAGPFTLISSSEKLLVGQSLPMALTTTLEYFTALLLLVNDKCVDRISNNSNLTWWILHPSGQTGWKEPDPGLRTASICDNHNDLLDRVRWSETKVGDEHNFMFTSRKYERNLGSRLTKTIGHTSSNHPSASKNGCNNSRKRGSKW